MKKRSVLFVVICLLLVFVPASAMAAFADLKDVKPADWFYSSVEFVYDEDLMSGVTEDTFAPANASTRAQVAMILYRMEGQPAVTGSGPFSDVNPGDWYYDAVCWAYQEDIIRGYPEGVFKPNAKITREQLAKMFYNYAAYCGYDLATGIDLHRYVDGDSVQLWADVSMEWAVVKGLISGVTPDTLSPQGTATRAQLAAILERFFWFAYGELTKENILDTAAGRYVFSAGVGNWENELTLNADGTFTGRFYDLNMGESGPGYENGTMYICEYDGNVYPVTRIGEYVYSTYVQYLVQKGKPGDEYIENGFRYIYTEPYGLIPGGQFHIYVPGTPKDKLPDPVEDWTSHLGIDLDSYRDYPFYAFYNVEQQEAFILHQ